MLTILKRIWETAWQGLRRNNWLFLACISTLVISLMIFTSIILLNHTANTVISFLKEKVDISLYFKPEIPEEDILKVRNLLIGWEEIESVDYVSKDEALKEFQQQISSNEALKKALEELGENPLSAALNIKAKNPQSYNTIVDKINASALKDKLLTIDLAENQKILEQMNKLLTGIQLVSLVCMVVLVLISFIIALNTIRMAIYSLKEEIEIMKLVGASPWFIRGPFLLEGALEGIFASIIAILLMIPIIIWFVPKIEIFFGNFQLTEFFWSHFIQIFLYQTLFGVFLGVSASFSAINKYLKI